jgi:hypothetical protein
MFTKATRVAVTDDLSLPIRQRGWPVDFTLADFDMPVVRRHVGEIIEGVAPDYCQHIPIRVEGTDDEYEILNVLRSIACVDEGASEFTKWNAADQRPDKVGAFRMITRLRLDPARASGAEIFRVQEWPIALVVGDAIRDALRAIEVSGIAFEPV